MNRRVARHSWHIWMNCLLFTWNDWGTSWKPSSCYMTWSKGVGKIGAIFLLMLKQPTGFCEPFCSWTATDVSHSSQLLCLCCTSRTAGSPSCVAESVLLRTEYIQIHWSVPCLLQVETNPGLLSLRSQHAINWIRELRYAVNPEETYYKDVLKSRD
jgi:hypothetical protein